MRCVQQTGCARVSLCEIDQAVRDRVASRYGLDEVFSDLVDAVGARPDAAVICTPAHLHVSMALRLAEAGVHLLIEKPLSTSLDGIARLQSLVAKQSLVAAVAYVHRANPILQAMRNAIHEGRFGTPLELVYVGGQNFPFFRPAYREIYYAKRETGGGAIQDGLTHMINAGEWLVGPVTSAAADAARLALDGVEVEDTVHVIARHGGVMASYAMNQHQAPNETTLTVVCERGTARAELHESRWRWKQTNDDPWHDAALPAAERDAAFIEQARCFLRSIDRRETPLCTLEEGLQTLRVNLALLAAVETRSWQSIPQADG